MPTRKRTWFLVRVTLYLVVIGFLIHARGNTSWQNLKDILKFSPETPSSLVISGHNQAPELIDRLLAAYQRDYPALVVSVRDGGTSRALEDLINKQADAAFLYTPPSATEQRLFREVTGDTAIVAPVAVGALLVAAPRQDDAQGLTPEELRTALRGGRPGLARFYLSDPNDGLWEDLGRNLGMATPADSIPSVMVFLADQAAVLAAVQAAAEAQRTDVWGLVSSLTLAGDPGLPPPPGVRFLTARTAPDSAAAVPTYENVATGRYPFHHRLYLACRGNDGATGGRFLTHLTSARGMRQVERAGTIPARQVLREIQLSRKPLGE